MRCSFGSRHVSGDKAAEVNRARCIQTDVCVRIEGPDGGETQKPTERRRGRGIRGLHFPASPVGGSRRRDTSIKDDGDAVDAARLHPRHVIDRRRNARKNGPMNTNDMSIAGLGGATPDRAASSRSRNSSDHAPERARGWPTELRTNPYDRGAWLKLLAIMDGLRHRRHQTERT